MLKYRLAREEGSTYKVEEHALWDAQRALRLVRSRAKQWGVDPARVGLLGFSAGGQVTSYAAARFDAGKPGAADPIERESSRPGVPGADVRRRRPGRRGGAQGRPARRSC